MRIWPRGDRFTSFPPKKRRNQLFTFRCFVDGRKIFTSSHNRKAIFTVRCILIYDFTYRIESWREWKNLWMACGAKRFCNEIESICRYSFVYSESDIVNFDAAAPTVFSIIAVCYNSMAKRCNNEHICHWSRVQWYHVSDIDAANQIADWKSTSQTLTLQLQMPLRCHKQSIANLNHWCFSTCGRSVLSWLW